MKIETQEQYPKYLPHLFTYSRICLACSFEKCNADTGSFFLINMRTKNHFIYFEIEGVMIKEQNHLFFLLKNTSLESTCKISFIPFISLAANASKCSKLFYGSLNFTIKSCFTYFPEKFNYRNNILKRLFEYFLF